MSSIFMVHLALKHNFRDLSFSVLLFLVRSHLLPLLVLSTFSVTFLVNENIYVYMIVRSVLKLLRLLKNIYNECVWDSNKKPSRAFCTMTQGQSSDSIF